MSAPARQPVDVTVSILAVKGFTHKADKVTLHWKQCTIISKCCFSLGIWGNIFHGSWIYYHGSNTTYNYKVGLTFMEVKQLTFELAFLFHFHESKSNLQETGFAFMAWNMEAKYTSITSPSDPTWYTVQANTWAHPDYQTVEQVQNGIWKTA